MTPTSEQIDKLPKWAREAWEEREQQFRCQIALRWPTYDKPEPRDMHSEIKALPAGSDRLITGWSSHSYALEFKIAKGCSNGTFHSSDCPTKTSSQNAGVFYHTKLDALKVARWNMSNQFASALARIDKLIEEEMP